MVSIITSLLLSDVLGSIHGVFRAQQQPHTHHTDPHKDFVYLIIRRALFTVWGTCFIIIVFESVIAITNMNSIGDIDLSLLPLHIKTRLLDWYRATPTVIFLVSIATPRRERCKIV